MKPYLSAFMACIVAFVNLVVYIDSALSASALPVSESGRPSQTAATATDLDRLQGEWVIIKCLRNGAEFPQELKTRMVVNGNKVTITSPDGTKGEYEIAINASMSPKTIDWTIVSNDMSGTLKGLYELKGDHLRTCSPASFGAERPTNIGTKRGDGQWVFEHKRLPAQNTD